MRRRSPAYSGGGPANRAAVFTALLALCLAAGCASLPGAPSAQVREGAATFERHAQSIELTDVPFFPQTEYQCGPAALATVLAHEGAAVTADDLAPAVYVEGLRGSLQAELLAATRRYGFVPYPLAPSADALRAELAAGRPVLVMQNLGLPRFPVWHYAVVVGYDAERSRIVLRSGTEKRREEKIKRFLRSWARADRWAFVAVRPGELPATADAEAWSRALNDAARVLPADVVADAFDAATARWPASPTALFGAAAYATEAGHYAAAERRYESLLALEPGHAAARNNLAHLLAERGCVERARQEAAAALGSLPLQHPLRPVIEDTVAELSALPTPSELPAAGCD